MSKCRVVLTRFYVFVEKQAAGTLANLPFHAVKTMKNEVCRTVAPGHQLCVPRRDALKGGTPKGTQGPPREPPGAPLAAPFLE